MRILIKTYYSYFIVWLIDDNELFLRYIKKPEQVFDSLNLANTLGERRLENLNLLMVLNLEIYANFN